MDDSTSLIELGRKLRCPDGSYIIFKSLLGHGATGAVYRCERVYPHSAQAPTELAAKVIDVRHLRLSRNFERERDKVKREIAILASLSHTGVVNLHGVIDSDEMLVLLMDLVDGGELFDFVLKKGRLNESEARYVMIQVVQTFKFLHKQGVIHRDLKLENILVEKEVAPGYYQIKIADFGLSKLIAGGFTRARSYVGTPQYWAPEVIQAGHDGGSYSFEADIWSMGCLLYVLVGGSYPFNGDAIDDLILRGEYTFDNDRFRSVSQECKSLIMGMLRVDPKKRLTLEEIESHPWLLRPLAPDAPPLPIIRQTPRTPITMNIGPTIVGAQVTESEPTKDVSMSMATPTSRVRSKLDSAVELFNASELLDLLGNTFYRFHAAYVAFRMHRKISSELQAMLLEIKDLTTQSTKVFKGFYYTCQQVLDLIGEVTLAVNDGDASLALALLDQLKEWVQDTVKDGVEVRKRFGAAVKQATLLVAYSRDLNAPWHTENWKSAPSLRALCASNGTLPMLEAPANIQDTNDGCKYSAARDDIFHDIQRVDDTASCDKSTAMASRLLDFLFVSPAVVPVNPSTLVNKEQDQKMSADDLKEGMKSTDSAVSTSETTQRVERLPSLQQGMTDIVPTSSPPSSPDMNESSNGSSGTIAVPHQPAIIAAEWRKAHYLMKGLEELQRVSDILEQCTAFWDNLDLTLGLIQKFKDQIVIVLKHSTKPASAARLTSRLKQYEGFWLALGEQCDRYVKGASTQSERMKTFVADFNMSMVKNNCAASIYTMTSHVNATP